MPSWAGRKHGRGGLVTHLQPSFAQGLQSSVHEQLATDTARSGRQRKIKTRRGLHSPVPKCSNQINLS